MSKVVIVGGGISGIVCASNISNNNEVIILERNNNILKKLLLTGNGKCNYFNEDFNINNYTSNSALDSIINDINKEYILKYFENIGVVKRIKNNYYYPFSSQSYSMQNILVNSLSSNVSIYLDNYVKDIILDNNKYIIKTNGEDIVCDKVVLANGGSSYYKTGSDGNGYELLKKLGLKLTDIHPGLCGIKTNESYKNISGIRVNGEVSLYENNKFIYKDFGEIQFTDYGLSGIVVFNISNHIKDIKHGVVKINFLKELNINNKDECIIFLNKQNDKLKDSSINLLLDSILNYNLGNEILKLCNIKFNTKYSKLTSEELDKLVSYLIEFSFNTNEFNNYDNAQITVGGLSLDEVNLNTFETKKYENLYVIGELLDINGNCGGFNIGMCALTGILAGRDISND